MRYMCFVDVCVCIMISTVMYLRIDSIIFQDSSRARASLQAMIYWNSDWEIDFPQDSFPTLLGQASDLMFELLTVGLSTYNFPDMI